MEAQQQIVQEASDLLRQSIDYIDEGVAITQLSDDRELATIIYGNQMMQHLSGHDEGRIIGQTIFDLLAGATKSLSKEKLQKAYEQDLSFEQVLTIEKDGQTYYWKYSIRRLHQDNGHNVFMERIKDVTREHISAKKQISQEELTKTLLKDNHKIFIHIDQNQEILSLNRRAGDFFGVDSDVMIGQNIGHFLTDTAMLHWLDAVNNVLDNGQKQDFYHEKEDKKYKISLHPITADHSQNQKEYLHDYEVYLIIENITQFEKAKTNLREKNQRYETIINNAPIILFTLDHKGRYTSFDGQVSKKIKDTVEKRIGDYVWDYLAPHHLVKNAFEKALQGEASTEHFKDETGTYMTSFSPIYDADHQIYGVIGVATDISDQVKTQEALQQSQERYALVAMGTNDGLWDWDLMSDEFYASPRFLSILGIEQEQSERQSIKGFLERIHIDDRDLFLKQMQDHLKSDKNLFETECRVIKPKDPDSHMWIQVRAATVRNEHNKPKRFAGSIADITERKESENRLIFNAFHDALTGLCNRSYFMEKIEKLIALNMTEEPMEFAVIFIDLDRFKVINDSLGHLVGDQVLCHVADVLRHSLRPSDTIARLGGDEFVVIIERYKDKKNLEQLCKRIIANLKKPTMIDDQEIVVSASLGIGLNKLHYRKPDEFMHDVDHAMYASKNSGKGTYRFVTDDTKDASQENLVQFEMDLRNAIQKNEIWIAYQPIYNMSKNELWGFEALARWHHSTQGVILPSKFIPLAEEIEYIDELGQYVINMVCKQIELWNHAFDKKFTQEILSVNISVKQLENEYFIAALEKIKDIYQIDTGRIQLEITESCLIQSPEKTGKIFDRLRKMGFRLCLDDFGTGYSSLSYLRDYPVDCIKLDRSFVVNIEKRPQDQSLVAVIAKLADVLGIELIIEGVENDDQVAMLKEAGCKLAQGFIYTKPLPVDTATKLLQKIYDHQSKDTVSSS